MTTSKKRKLEEVVDQAVDSIILLDKRVVASRMTDVDFSGCVVTDSILEYQTNSVHDVIYHGGSTFHNCVFKGDLTDVILNGTYTSCDFTDATLDETTLIGVYRDCKSDYGIFALHVAGVEDAVNFTPYHIWFPDHGTWDMSTTLKTFDQMDSNSWEFDMGLMPRDMPKYFFEIMREVRETLIKHNVLNLALNLKGGV